MRILCASWKHYGGWLSFLIPKKCVPKFHFPICKRVFPTPSLPGRDKISAALHEHQVPCHCSLPVKGCWVFFSFLLLCAGKNPHLGLTSFGQFTPTNAILGAGILQKRMELRSVCAGSVGPVLKAQSASMFPSRCEGRRGSPHSQAGLITHRWELPSELPAANHSCGLNSIAPYSPTCPWPPVIWMSCSFQTLSSDHIYPKKQLLLGGPDLRLRQYHKTTFYSLPYPINVQEISSCLCRSRRKALRTYVRSPSTRFSQPLSMHLCGKLPYYPWSFNKGAKHKIPRVAYLFLKHFRT